jgi:hypothetical protein
MLQERAVARRFQCNAHKLMKILPPELISPEGSGRALYQSLKATLEKMFKRTSKHGAPRVGSTGFRVGEALILAVKSRIVVNPIGSGPILLMRGAQWVKLMVDLEREKELERARSYIGYYQVFTKLAPIYMMVKATANRTTEWGS